MSKIKIQITSDYVCPWCLVGHTRLEKAIETSGLRDRVEVEFLPYQLNPAAPEEGQDRREYLSAKFGGPEKLAEMDAKMKEIGAGDGIEFRQDLIKRSPNTFNAHRLAWFAAKNHPEQAVPLSHKILEAYFTKGEDIGNIATLASIAESCGIDKSKASAFLESKEGTDEVKKLEEGVRARGVRMVPNFLIDGEEIVGAYPVDVYTQALKNALKKAA